MDRVAQIDVAGGCRPLVRLGNDLLLQDAHFADHEQSQIRDDGVRQVPVRDVIAGDVQSEILALNAAAVGEFNLKIELDAFLHHRSIANAVQEQAGLVVSCFVIVGSTLYLRALQPLPFAELLIHLALKTRILFADPRHLMRIEGRVLEPAREFCKLSLQAGNAVLDFLQLCDPSALVPGALCLSDLGTCA